QARLPQLAAHGAPGLDDAGEYENGDRVLADRLCPGILRIEGVERGLRIARQFGCGGGRGRGREGDGCSGGEACDDCERAAIHGISYRSETWSYIKQPR